MALRISADISCTFNEQKLEPETEFKTLKFCSKQQSLTLPEMITYYPTATAFSNTSKNRYHNVLPNESTRVKLSDPPDGETDYINANYMNDKKNIILSQAPIPNTFHHFWIMVLENNITVITMLTPVIKGKADKYWPDLGQSMTFGKHDKKIIVTCKSITNPEDGITIAGLVVDYIVNNTIQKQISIHHIHVKSWPDHSIPDCKSIVKNVVQYIKSNLKIDSGLLIHCSAGLGRAGTLITIWELDSPENNNVMEIVCDLRNYRAGIVQTKEQYKFIHSVHTSIKRSPLSVSY